MVEDAMSDITAMANKWWVFVLAGVLIVLLGMFAIVSPYIAGLAIALVVGWVFLFAGILHIVQAFWNMRTTSLWLPLLIGVFYFIVGLALLAYPILTLVSLTLLLGAFFLIEGILTILWAFQRGVQNRGWLIFSGVITLILAFIILSQWPVAAAWVVGTLVGIELIFRGVSLMSLGFALHGRGLATPMGLAGGHA